MKAVRKSGGLPQIGGGTSEVHLANQNSSGETRRTGGSDNFNATGLTVAVCTRQGKRPYQEDEFMIRSYVGDPVSSQSPETHMLCLFDGHAGGRCSKYLSQCMSNVIAADPQFYTNLPQAFKRSFHTANDAFLKIADRMRAQDGSTGICVIMRDGKYLIANVGDCRAILLSEGRPIQLSKDQKPTNFEEQRRIIKLGGTIMNCMGVVRVNGVLAVSRAFGNRGLRDVIRPDAEITQRSIGSGDDFLVMASDGLWDVLTNAVVSATCYKLADQSSQTIADELVNTAINRGSMDNVTCIVVKLGPYTKRVLQNYDSNSAQETGQNSASAFDSIAKRRAEYITSLENVQAANAVAASKKKSNSHSHSNSSTHGGRYGALPQRPSTTTTTVNGGRYRPTGREQGGSYILPERTSQSGSNSPMLRPILYSSNSNSSSASGGAAGGTGGYNTDFAPIRAAGSGANAGKRTMRPSTQGGTAGGGHGSGNYMMASISGQNNHNHGFSDRGGYQLNSTMGGSNGPGLGGRAGVGDALTRLLHSPITTQIRATAKFHNPNNKGARKNY